MSWASGWDKLFKKVNNVGRKIDPLGHKVVDAVVKNDSKNIKGIAGEMSDWFGGDDTWLGARLNDLRDEAQKNEDDPVRAQGRAALTFGALYGAGATGLGGAGASSGAAGAGAAGGEAAAGLGGAGAGGSTLSTSGLWGTGTLGEGYLGGSGLLGSTTVGGTGGASTLSGAYGSGLAGAGAYGGAGGITSAMGPGSYSGGKGVDWMDLSQRLMNNMQQSNQQNAQNQSRIAADNDAREQALALALELRRQQQLQAARNSTNMLVMDPRTAQS